MLGIDTAEVSSHRAPWNKGRLIGQKRPLKPKEVCFRSVRGTVTGARQSDRARPVTRLLLLALSALRGREISFTLHKSLIQSVRASTVVLRAS